MRQYLAAVVCICMVIISCQKEIDFDGANNSGQNPATSVRCTSCSYLPVCDSTQLTYIDSTAAGLDTLASTLAILGDTTITGTKFTRVTRFAAFRQGLLYNCNGGNYRINQPVPDLGIDIDSLFQSAGLPTGPITLPSQIQTTILKSTASTGTTWSDTVFKITPIPFFTIVAKLDYKIEEKNVQRTVSGNTFNNVIHVSSKLNVIIPLMQFPLDVVVDYFFADGVGIIESRTTNNGTVASETRLYKYKIK